MLFLPELVPRNVQQTTGELDEELLLLQQELKLKSEVFRLTGRYGSTAPPKVDRLLKHSAAAGRLDPGLYA